MRFRTKLWLETMKRILLNAFLEKPYRLILETHGGAFLAGPQRGLPQETLIRNKRF